MIKGKRVIHIVSFLYYIQEKVWEGSENKEEAWMQIFDVVQLRRQIIKCCDFFMIFTAFPGFSLDITEETYNIDPTVALYEKKFPFRTVCYGDFGCQYMLVPQAAKVPESGQVRAR